VSSTSQMDTRLIQFQTQLDTLLHEIVTSSLNSEVQHLVQALVDRSDLDLDLIRQKRIKDSLSFNEINSRYNSIENAHEKTFNWVYGEDEDSEEDSDSGSVEYGSEEDDGDSDTDSDSVSVGYNAQEDDSDSNEQHTVAEEPDKNLTHPDTEPRESEDVECDAESNSTREALKHMEEDKKQFREKLIRWLSLQTGIFHVAGKFGCGKSTLMQYIWAKAETRSLLQSWAGTLKASTSGT
jgi:hypothetical protein